MTVTHLKINKAVMNIHI